MVEIAIALIIFWIIISIVFAIMWYRFRKDMRDDDDSNWRH